MSTPKIKVKIPAENVPIEALHQMREAMNRPEDYMDLELELEVEVTTQLGNIKHLIKTGVFTGEIQ